MLRRKVLGAFLMYAFLVPGFALGQANGAGTATGGSSAKVYSAPKADIDKIRDEGMNRSQVIQHLSYLTDVIGGRLTNSPNMKRANEWTRDTMAKWGMQNAKARGLGSIWPRLVAEKLFRTGGRAADDPADRVPEGMVAIDKGPGHG